MATEIYYGGVRLYNVTTRNFEQEAVLDASGTDVLCYRFNITVSGMVTGIDGSDAESAAAVGPQALPQSVSGSTTAAATNHAYLRKRLMNPRQKFRMFVGSIGPGQQPEAAGPLGILLLGCDPPSGTMLSTSAGIGTDLENGPHPKRLKITKIVGNNTFHVEYEISLAVLECGAEVTGPNPTGPINNTGVLSNRWSTSDDIDANFYTTRTIQGVLRVASAELNPMSFRRWVIGVPDKGFKVEHWKFTQSADSLTLTYECVFREIAFAAPPPATSWSLTHSETFGQNTGYLANTSVAVMLRGPRTADKLLLFDIAAKILTLKAFGLTAPPKRDEQSFIVQEIVLTDSYSDTDSFVEARALVQHIGADKDAAFSSLYDILSSQKRRLGKPIEGYDLTTGIDPATVNPEQLPGGTASIARAFSAYYQTACSTVHERLAVSVAPLSLFPGSQNYPTPQYSIGTTPERTTADYSDDHKKALYTSYRAESRYVTEQNKVQLPFAGGGVLSSNPDTSVVVTLGLATAKRIIRVHAERVSRSPVLPAGKDFTDPKTNVKYTLLDTVVLAVNPDKAPDGQFKHEADIEYTYALSRPLTASEQMLVVRPPWLKDGVNTDEGDVSLAAGIASVNLLTGPP